MNRSFLIYAIKTLMAHKHEYTWEKTRHPYSNYFDEVFVILPLEDQKELRWFYKQFIKDFGISLLQAEKYLYYSKMNFKKKFVIKIKVPTIYGYTLIQKVNLPLREMDNQLRVIKVWLNKKIRYLCDQQELDFRELEEAFPTERK